MANRTLFSSLVGALIPKATARNLEGAPAYERPPEQALAQYAATGCLNATFYADARDQLTRALALAEKVSPDLVAKTAIYSRERGQMKDMPALLLAVLSRRDPRLMDRVFDRVVDSGRMVRTFVQIVRSGETGRKSLGSAPKRCVRRWLDQRTDAALVAASVGGAPSLADIVRIVHPRPQSREREVLYGYFLGRRVDPEGLPESLRAFEAFKTGRQREVPDVPFQLLTGLDLDVHAWRAIARQAPWQMTRMNLNTFARHGVFGDPALVDLVSDRLRDAAEIARARVLPYQVLAAARFLSPEVPAGIRQALDDAMDAATANVPAIDGHVYICPDVSGSMESALTGFRRGATTTIRCVDVAGLIASALLRQNRTAEVLPFSWGVRRHQLSAREGVLTNTARLAALLGGGTSVSAPLRRLNARKATGDLVVIVSDNQSWVDASGRRGTATMREWNVFRARNPQAKLVLMDLQPHGTTQALDREDVLNVGGFSDQVFSLVADFAAGRLLDDHWVGAINAVEL